MMKVVIYMIVYGRRETTQKSINSLFKHTHHPFTLVIVNNNFPYPDGTKEFLEKLKREHPNIKIIENDINKGITISCYQVLKEEDADICIKFDNDIEILTDFWLKSMVEIYRMVKNKYRYFILGTNILHFICQTF